MKRTLRLTEDGSHTLFQNNLDEPYHSMHGAVQESMHVFIIEGYKQKNESRLNILEIGFGTGLNFLLTYNESHPAGISVHYHAVEKYPLALAEYKGLNYESFIEGIQEGILQKIHDAPWDTEVTISKNIILYKELSDFRSMKANGPFDLVYFDAFAPQKQPELWSSEVFRSIAQRTIPGSILVTYSSKGSVQRALKESGFHVIKVPGPPGKREMIRATRI